MISRGAVDELRRTDPGELHEYVNSLLRDNEVADGSADVDRLRGNGVALARAGLNDLDGTALKWLLDKPTPERLDAVSAFLDGYWSYLPRLAPEHDQRITQFIECADSLASSTEIEYGFLRAVAAALRADMPMGTRDRIRSILDSASQRDFGPQLQPLVKSLAERARKPGEKPN